MCPCRPCEGGTSGGKDGRLIHIRRRVGGQLPSDRRQLSDGHLSLLNVSRWVGGRTATCQEPLDLNSNVRPKFALKEIVKMQLPHKEAWWPNERNTNTTKRLVIW